MKKNISIRKIKPKTFEKLLRKNSTQSFIIIRFWKIIDYKGRSFPEDCLGRLGSHPGTRTAANR